MVSFAIVLLEKPHGCSAEISSLTFLVADSDGSPEDTVEFELKVKCTKNPQAPKDATTPDELYRDHVVYTRHLTWVPLGSQPEIFGNNPPKPVHDDIILAKLRPGQVS